MILRGSQGRMRPGTTWTPLLHGSRVQKGVIIRGSWGTFLVKGSDGRLILNLELTTPSLCACDRPLHSGVETQKRGKKSARARLSPPRIGFYCNGGRRAASTGIDGILSGRDGRSPQRRCVQDSSWSRFWSPAGARESPEIRPGFNLV